MRIISRGSCSPPSRVRRLLAPYFDSDEYSGKHDNPWRERMRETARQAGQLDSFTSVSCFELQSYMVNTLLRDTDTASMANSLEVRVPFLDHRLVEFVGRLPKSVKYTPDVPKSLLVEALSDLLPKRSSASPSEHLLCLGKSGCEGRSACACRRICQISRRRCGST